jgi:hippurate hydrolase
MKLNPDQSRELNGYLPELTDWRRQLHANPETAFEEYTTSKFVAERLRAFGVDEVHTGIAGTGLVGVIRRGSSTRAIGLRADMDALNIEEASGKPWASKVTGKMHACGHDGHTAMLLGAARYLASNRDFNGTVYLIFQPAEEGAGGGQKMVEEGLFDRFPMQAVYAMHNTPGVAVGQFSIMAGPMMAASDTFDIRITGRGAHAAMPNRSIDPIVIGSELVQQFQTIVSRSLNPQDTAVVSVTQFHAGTTFNAIPDDARVCGTVRTFSAKARDLVEARIRARCEAAALAHGASVDLKYERHYPPTVNDAGEAERCLRVARELVGDENVLTHLRPAMASEDFSFMLQACPGAYVWIGNGTGENGGCLVHNPKYDFNDDAIAPGVAFWIKLVEDCLN